MRLVLAAAALKRFCLDDYVEIAELTSSTVRLGRRALRAQFCLQPEKDW
jgi:hypothetical protein